MSNGHKPLVRLLLANGADAFSMNKNGETPLDLSKDDGIKELLAKMPSAASPKKHFLGPPLWCSEEAESVCKKFYVNFRFFARQKDGPDRKNDTIYTSRRKESVHDFVYGIKSFNENRHPGSFNGPQDLAKMEEEFRERVTRHIPKERSGENPDLEVFKWIHFPANNVESLPGYKLKRFPFERKGADRMCR